MLCLQLLPLCYVLLNNLSVMANPARGIRGTEESSKEREEETTGSSITDLFHRLLMPNFATLQQSFEATFGSTSPPTSSPPISSQPPTPAPSVSPTPAAPSSLAPTSLPLSYVPGNLSHVENGLLLSEGLTVRILAQSGMKVNYSNGEESIMPFHIRPDAGATFVDERASNPGGWIYVSNAERRWEYNMETNIPEWVDPGMGGVGAITFDADGNVIKYDMILRDTTHNCGGGRTPWNTWVSCEESVNGTIWQVDPYGERPSEQITLGKDYGGKFESFAYDVRDLNNPKFFVTRDSSRGEIRRFQPSVVDWTKPWDMLQAEGTIDYLILQPSEVTDAGGTFRWTTDMLEARLNARDNYPNCEGIDEDGNRLYFVSKVKRQLFELNLDRMTYRASSTISGVFDGQPDQIQRIVHAGLVGGNIQSQNKLLYFTEEGGLEAGIHARNVVGKFYTILESPFFASDETTGLAFSPNGKHLYVSFQRNGILFDVTRSDGRAFDAMTLNVKYHAVFDS